MRAKLNFSSIFTTLILFIILGSSCSTQQRFSAFDKRKVHHFEMVELGGVKQAVLINGKSADNPVLLYLHGGPGFPMLPFDPFTEEMKELEKTFTIVYWEQRGTGKSFHPDMGEENMSIEQFVSDTRELVDYIRKKLKVDKVFLWGHSWGTNLGALYAARNPETLHAYISTGQSVNPFLNERLAYEFVQEKAELNNNRRALRQLSKIDTLHDKYTLGDALTVRKWVYRFGGIVYDSRFERPYVDFAEIRTILLTPVYPLMVRVNLLLNPYFSIETLWEDLKALNLFDEAPRIDVPVYFLVGRHDVIVSQILAHQYFEKLKAPEGKRLVWFEKSAHRPFQEEKQKFLEVMQNINHRHWENELSSGEE